VRIPSFSRHAGTTAARDDSRNAAANNRDVPDSRTMRSGPPDEPTTQRIRYGGDDTRHDLPPVPGDHTAAAPDHTVRDKPVDRPAPVVAGPRPRASLLATLSLILGVVAALVVLTGLLAGYGIGLGVLAALLAVGGIAATRRRHVAGKSDALIGLVLGLGAVVVGIMALTGALPWLGTDTDSVSQLRDWLDRQFVDRF
jgi:hypothetical protein